MHDYRVCGVSPSWRDFFAAMQVLAGSLDKRLSRLPAKRIDLARIVIKSLAASYHEQKNA
jgi:hypothetical protein